MKQRIHSDNKVLSIILIVVLLAVSVQYSIIVVSVKADMQSTLSTKKEYNAKIQFDSGGYNTSFSLPVVKRANLSSVSISLQGLPHPADNSYLSEPSITIGNEIKSSWKYPYNYGDFGKTNFFEGNSIGKNLSFNQAGSQMTYLVLPKASIINADMRFVFSSSIDSEYNLSLDIEKERILQATWSDQLWEMQEASFPGMGSSALAISTSSINTDNFPDILTAQKIGYMGVLINNQNGTFMFEKNLITKQPYDTNDVVSTDLDNNNIPEILGASDDRRIYVVYNYQNGSYDMISPTAMISSEIYHLGIIDLDEDSFNDAVSATKNGNILLYMNSGGTIYSPTTIGNIKSTPMALELMDMDNNGTKDVITVSYDGDVFILPNSGSSFSTPIKVFTHQTNITDARISDLDRDGINDIIIGDMSGKVTILRGTGNFGYVEWKSLVLTQGKKITAIDISDMDNDAYSDVIASDSDMKIHLIVNENGVNFKSFVAGSLPYSVADLVSFDVDKDGCQDIIAAVDRYLYVGINKLRNFNTALNFQSALNKYLMTASYSTDQWGNEITNVPLNITSKTPGNVTLSDLDIEHNYTPAINITSVVDSYVRSNPANSSGYVKVPLNFTSDSAGILNVKITVFYSRMPPYLLAPVPSTYSFPEDTTGTNLIDLEKYFSDDNDDGRLSFKVMYEEDPLSLHAVASGRYLTFHPAKHWYGTRAFKVSATDSEGSITDSNMFNVTVYHVNHLPEFRNLPTQLKVTENLTYPFDLRPYIYDVEDGLDLAPSTSDPANITIAGTNLSMKYSGANYTKYVSITITDKENGSATAQMDIIVKPYGSPIFLPIPPWRTPTGVNVSASSSPIDLKDFVMDADTSKDFLDFIVVSQTNVDANAYITGSKVCLSFLKDSVSGSTIAHLRVSDGKWTDETYLLIEFTQRVVYLGGLQGGTVVEDTTWGIDLAPFFNLRNISYLTNDPRVLVDGPIASWSPRNGDADIENLTFMAFDPLDPQNNATSEPIDLIVIPRNDPPVYIGGLTSQIVFEGSAWQVDLRNCFTDEETPDELDFKVNTQNVTLNGTVANWRPNEGSQTIRDVVFTATDFEGLNTSSDPIDLVYIRVNKQPTAIIDSASPTTANRNSKIHFRGHGIDLDGNITEYAWRSDKDGAISNTSEFDALLSPGRHMISFMVMDDKGLWSRPAYTNVTILGSLLESGTLSPEKQLLIKSMAIGGIVILVGGLITHTKKVRKRRRGGRNRAI